MKRPFHAIYFLAIAALAGCAGQTVTQTASDACAIAMPQIPTALAAKPFLSQTDQAAIGDVVTTIQSFCASPATTNQAVATAALTAAISELLVIEARK